ncbi:fumarylacetoacetate hydrolase family protein [Hyphomonas polymorpha PS728]|uniref:Fumarylacetoacetate hydrolase family protein n=1 Tax=Hyphomonas polymorpha PS728 TaxID=1280954 RepID=A0A062VQV1_9PROT|nr:fumarylacetoacetate hydrolase family protein [Hyphomonas polymorpha]KDA00684.1 fumarylacetoacetate hydrolase family protein [Hyphomonas polymorpha PS728]
MRLVRFVAEGLVRFGHLEGDTVVPVAGDSFVEALEGKEKGAPLALSVVHLLAPVPRPGKILGIGVNYAAHAAESVSFINTAKLEVQKWFNKQATAVNGPYDPVHLPKVSGQLDYEGELVAVIGRHGRHVPRARAMEIVAGFCIGCDYSVRDWQKASQTMIMGKGFDTHAPFGPALVTPDEIEDLPGLEVRSYVNGEQRQSGHVRDMIHDIAAQIEHLTAAFTLEPGDVIFTGTPAGVGAGFDPPKWLKAGDRVRIEIDGLGHIENEIVPEPDTTRIG